MAQDKNPEICIVGGGPAGCACAYFLRNFCNVTVFEKSEPLKTLLPTGGGRCNLAHNDFDVMDLAENYPRGKKFLYSVFSKFGTADTLKMFEEIGVKTYIQDDGRIFPTSDSSKDVREKFLNALSSGKHSIMFKKETVRTIKYGDDFVIETDKTNYHFNYVVLATGGHAGFELIRDLGIDVVEPKPALTGLVTETDFSSLSGVSLQNIICIGYDVGDILFTHKGISGPLIYKISSINARNDFPYILHFKFCEIDNMQELLNKNSRKNIFNLISQFVPKSFAKFILDKLNVLPDTKCYMINGKTRDRIVNELENFEVKVVGCFREGEIVTSGGINLAEINSKTMELKRFSKMYAIGELPDIDGFCGGYNLQNCWSTAFVCANAIINRLHEL